MTTAEALKIVLKMAHDSYRNPAALRDIGDAEQQREVAATQCDDGGQIKIHRCPVRDVPSPQRR